jgi:peroxiredoxin
LEGSVNLGPGDQLADYELPNHDKVQRKLSDIQGSDPMILTLARGHYCPKEHQQHLELAAHYPKIAVAYTRIATIATDEHHTLQEAWDADDLSAFHGWNKWDAGKLTAAGKARSAL